MDLEKSIEIGNLFGFYKNLLTEKQQSIFESYYYQDIGLTEIAQNLGVTKQTVLDTLKKTEKNLLEFERALKLSKIFEKQNALVEKIKKDGDLSKLDNIIMMWED
ncbi:MAG: YlxM family DNA-binding protein [Christensenellales bacterium]